MCRQNNYKACLTMGKVKIDYSKLPRKYNRKSKLDAAVKSVKTLLNWKNIIYDLRRGQSCPTDPFTEEVLQNCLNILKKSTSREQRQLTGLAKDLLSFSDLSAVWVRKYGWVLHISDSLEIKQDISFSWGLYYMSRRGPLLVHPHEELLSIQEVLSEYCTILNNVFITS